MMIIIIIITIAITFTHILDFILRLDTVSSSVSLPKLVRRILLHLRAYKNEIYDYYAPNNTNFTKSEAMAKPKIQKEIPKFRMNGK